LISKAIETGNTDIITKAVEISVQKKTNNSNVINNTEISQTVENNIDQSSITITQSEIVDETTEKIENIESVKDNILKVNNLIKQEVEKLKIENPEIDIEENLLVNVKEVLASPN